MRPPDESLSYTPLQKLPTPDGSVGAVAGSVQRNPDHALFVRSPVVRQATGDVCVVVLHAHRRKPRLHQLRLHVEEPAVVLDPFSEGTQGLVVLQVADVVAEEGVATLGQAEGVLEL